MKETCCYLFDGTPDGACPNPATLQVTDPLAPNEPTYSCDDHLANFIPDCVVISVNRLEA